MSARILAASLAACIVVTACSSSGTATPRFCAAEAGSGEGDNGARFRAVDLGGALLDEPDSSRTLPWTPRSSTEDDWFSVQIDDSGFGGDPNVRVRASAGTVTTWFVCKSGEVVSLDCRGAPGPAESFGGAAGQVEGCEADPTADPPVVVSATDCSGTSDDDGVLWIRVRRASCEPYTLQIDVN